MTERNLDFGPYYVVNFQDMVEIRPRIPLSEEGNIPYTVNRGNFARFEQAQVELNDDTLHFSLSHKFGFYTLDDDRKQIATQQTDGIRFRLGEGNLWEGVLDTDEALSGTDIDLFRKGVSLYLTFILNKLPDFRKH